MKRFISLISPRLTSIWYLPLLLAFLLLSGCAQKESNLPTTTLTLQGHKFEIEIARTEADRETGLMKRDSMPKYHGMIFIFETPDIYPFWMHNTRIPLDIIWLSSTGKILTIVTMQPYVEKTESNTSPALYVLELNAGMAQELSLKPGMQITLPPDVLTPPSTNPQVK